MKRRAPSGLETMTTSGDTFPNRFTSIDSLTRPDHSYLTDSDRCYYLGEYTARQGFAYSQTNQLILNFKKSLARRGLPEWRYKNQAIRQVAGAFKTAIHPRILEIFTFVPIPPSKMKSHPLYDDRLSQMLQLIDHQCPRDVREIIVQRVNAKSAHERSARPTPDELAVMYEIDENQAVPEPGYIARILNRCWY